MPALSILQVAVSGRPVRERIAGKVSQIPAAPARLGREVGLVLQRAKGSVTHGVAATESAPSDPGAEARLEQVLALEASRRAPLTHPDDGVSVVTVVALGHAALWGTCAPGDARGIEASLGALASVPDGGVTRLAVHLAPDAGQAFDASAVSEGYPHLAPVSFGAASQTKCRFCGVSFEAYRTTCPSCGGAVVR